MKKHDVRWLAVLIFLVSLAVLSMSAFSPVFAQAVPGGTLNPTTIPKYVQPLVIPPEMPKSTTSPSPAADYDIAVRQFKQQILPGGLWNVLNGRTDSFPSTTVWSYGRAQDPAPDIRGVIPTLPAGVAPAPNSSFNYPAFTVENISMVPTKVRWINDLKDPATGNYLPHLLPVDQTLHWANPPKANCVMGSPNRTDCETAIAAPYTGPVPFVTHVHGAHVQPHSDGYPEAWWLPAANNIPAGYAMRGSHFGQADNSNTVPGSAFFSYENTQPATTIWYHDHALGMTRLNVYAGPAGFWLIRGGANDLTTGLPVSAPTGTGDPNFDAAYRATIREVPIAIQDRSFNTDGSLFYPADRTFFDGFTGPYIDSTVTSTTYNPGPPPTGPSDMSGIWNPEAFFNTMVVNGTTWPFYEVANGRYRLRLLNGCNSRMLNLSLRVVTSLGLDGIAGTADDVLGAEVPFYQIGAEQGFLPKVVMIRTGFATQLPGNGTIPAETAAPDPAQALLMGNAERADVIVDFKGMANGTRIRMINTAPDSPFGGFPVIPSDPLTTGQVMDFIVNTALELPCDSNTTAPQNLVLPAEAPLGAATNTRKVTLNEMSSDQVCVEVDAITGAIIGTLFSTTPGDPNFLANCAAAVVGPGNVATPMGPRQAQLGVVSSATGTMVAVPLKWGDGITERPSLNSTEVWEIFNTTVDAHPIHVHMVEFQVVNREILDPAALLAGNLVQTGVTTSPLPSEMGYKDTVIAYPGQITRIKAKFNIAGLYVWHCHIVEHEDNEMMRPFVVTGTDLLLQNTVSGDLLAWNMNGSNMTGYAFLNPQNPGAANWSAVATDDFNNDGQSDILMQNSVSGDMVVWYMDGTNMTSYALLNPQTPGAANWSVVATGDFNNDGSADILMQNTVSGDMVVWYMNGISMTSYAYLNPQNPGGSGWKVVAVKDFNGDGKVDVLFQDAGTGDLVVWNMNGITMTSFTYLNPQNPGGLSWKVAAVKDFNTDGQPDILFQNAATDDLVVWNMSGINMTSFTYLNPQNTGAPNWKVIK